MNTAETMRHADRQDTRPASTGSPASSIPTPTIPRWSPYADLVLPDTTYLERWDCISLLDRPIGAPTGRRDAIRQPVVEARPRRAALPGRADRSRRPARPAGLRRTRTARPNIRRLSRLHRQSRAHARHRPARRLARRGRHAHSGGARPIPTSSSATSSNGCFWHHELTPDAAYFKHANRAYLEFGGEDGLPADAPSRSSSSSIASRCRSFRLAAHGHGAVSRRRAHRARIERISIRCRSGTCPSRRRRSSAAPSRCTPSPSGRWHMYHSWGSQNAWLRQIHRPQPPLHAPRARRRRSAWRTTTGSGSRAATAGSRARSRLMEGVNPNTVWTWNAIGKRAGAWGLDGDAPEVRRGLPAQPPDRRAPAGDATAATAFPTPIRSPARRPGTICASACEKARRGEAARPRRASSRVRQPPGLDRRLPSSRFGAEFNAERSSR